MQSKFIYVFDKDARDRLLSASYQLLKADEQQNIFVFENSPEKTMDFSEKNFVFSNTLTF